MIGIDGVYNYGCEAIVRGTELILRRQWPNARIIYASRRPEDDQSRLEGADLEIIHRKFNRYSLTNIIRKSISYAGIKWSPRIDSLSLLRGLDAVLFIGGDIYTLLPDGSYNANWLKFGNAAEKRGVPYILWGASVGPFTRNPRAERVFQKHLSNIHLVTAREKDSVNYLAGIGVSDNVVSCADPAFAVGPDMIKESHASNEKFTLGINLSPLSLMYSGLEHENAVSKQAQMIECLVETLDAAVMLIPHVVCDFNERDDDLRYLQQVKNKISGQYQDQVILLNKDLGFMGTRKKLIECDLVIAARMHCAINALAAHVPTLLLSYSQKAQGMCEYIYGHRDWVLPLNDFCSEQCLSTIRKMRDCQSDIQTYLAGRMPDVQCDVYKPLESLKEIVKQT